MQLERRREREKRKESTNAPETVEFCRPLDLSLELYLLPMLLLLNRCRLLLHLLFCLSTFFVYQTLITVAALFQSLLSGCFYPLTGSLVHSITCKHLLFSTQWVCLLNFSLSFSSLKPRVASHCHLMSVELMQCILPSTCSLFSLPNYQTISRTSYSQILLICNFLYSLQLRE